MAKRNGTAASGLSEAAQDFLKALASTSRQQILLLFADGRPRSVGEIAAEAGIGQSTASEQLALLRRGGIMTARREGKIVLYFPDSAGIASALDELQRLLMRCCPPTEDA
ncbi:ArsR/SmtB family transcription factor [Allorhizocola rhizosphaerae]|uniref:ArsR/SmtB family transcription factor n=1 Tax=Allorhizocola rhizosphaerae TaxID=1872709 RepID=UPI000E3D8664|nr:metalloregulator ArsR/SmtB family transcription factor [Allorhizocola rhizosphaerae]